MDIAPLIRLIIYLLLGGLVIYLCIWIIGILELPDPIRKIAIIIVAVVALLWLVKYFGLLP